jgi:hypothetical protein
MKITKLIKVTALSCLMSTTLTLSGCVYEATKEIVTALGLGSGVGVTVKEKEEEKGWEVVPPNPNDDGGSRFDDFPDFSKFPGFPDF